MALVYPKKKSNFIVTIGELGQADFSEVSTLNALQDLVNKQKGLVEYGNVILKRGTIRRKEVFDWMVQADTKNLKRCDVKITLLDDNRKPVIDWTIINALPIKYNVSNFNKNDIAIELLELTCEGIIRL